MTVGEIERAKTKYLDCIRDEKRLQSSTIAIYEMEVNRLIGFIQNSSKLREDIRKYLSKLSPATHSRKLIIWRGFLKFCPASVGKVLDDFATPKLRQRQPTFLTEHESFQLEGACFKRPSKFLTRNRLLVGFALQLGLRVSEIVRLKFKDFEEGWVRIFRKGDKEQRLPVPASLLTLLTYLKKENMDPNATDYIFVGREGSPLTTRGAQLIIKEIAHLAGIKKRITPHSLRHTFATQLSSRGAPLSTIKEFLGHERLATTERYLHVSPSHLEDALTLLKTPLRMPTAKPSDSHPPAQ